MAKQKAKTTQQPAPTDEQAIEVPEGKKIEEDLTPEELQQLFELQGRKLGALLALSDLPDEHKVAWASVLDKLSPQQMDKLTEVLEERYLNSVTQDIDEEYDRKTQELMRVFAEEDKEDYTKILEEATKVVEQTKKLKGDE
ncbi:hypothetical protein ACFL2D_01145 [Patescibacteria group bacterium]